MDYVTIKNTEEHPDNSDKMSQWDYIAYDDVFCCRLCKHDANWCYQTCPYCHAKMKV